MMNSWNQKNLLQQTYSSNHVHEVLIIPHDDIYAGGWSVAFNIGEASIGLDYEVRKATEKEYEVALDFLALAFSKSREYFIEYESLPWFRYNREKWIGLLGGKIISNVDLFTREIFIGKSPILVGDIGHVATHPSYRNLGYGSELIKNVLREMDRKCYNISFLFGGDNVYHFYDKMGWVAFPEKIVNVEIRRETELTNPNLEMEKLEGGKDFNDVIELYNKYDRQITGSTVRTHEYWLRYRDWMIKEPNFILLWREKGDPVACSLCEGGSTGLRILWICYDRKNDQILSSILKGIINYAIKNKYRYINVGFLPLDHPILKILKMMPVETVCRNNNNMMVRLINVKSLFEKILPELEERLNRSNLKGLKRSITIECEIGNVTITIYDNEVKVEGRREDAVHIPLDKKSLVKLILGHTTFEKIDQYIEISRKIGLTDKDIKLMSALFPKQYPIHWNYGHY